MSAPSPLSPPARPLDTSALTQPIDEPALTAFIADSKATGKPWQRDHHRPAPTRASAMSWAS